MSSEEEESWIRKAVASFKETSPTGKVPVGWYYGRPSARSLPLVAKVYKELGFVFSPTSLATFADLALQSRTSLLGRHVRRRPSLLEEGQRRAFGDDALHARLQRLQSTFPRPFLASYKDLIPLSLPSSGSAKSAATTPLPSTASTPSRTPSPSSPLTPSLTPNPRSTIREEGLEGRPAYITVALHSRWIGRPGRFQALKKIVEHFSSFDDVWFATREQIARHFAKEVPFPA